MCGTQPWTLFNPGFYVETKWGLGLQNIDDLPAADIYNFGLVSVPYIFTNLHLAHDVKN